MGYTKTFKFLLKNFKRFKKNFPPLSKQFEGFKHEYETKNKMMKKDFCAYLTCKKLMINKLIKF